MTTEIIESPPASSSRSASDVLRLAVGAGLVLLSVLVEWLTGDSLPRSVADLLSGFDTLPDWAVELVLTLTRLLVAVLLVAGVVSVLSHRRWRNLFSVAVAAGLAVGMTAVANALDHPPVGTIVEVELRTVHEYPTGLGLAAVTAVVTAAAPWLSRRWRRIAWVLVIALAVSRFLTAPVSFENVRALAIGWLAGAAVLVAFGGPDRRPRGEAIAAGLARVGVPLQRLEQASLDARGSTPYFARTTDGTELFVKALGTDERSADILFRLYRRILPRNLGDERPFSSLRRAVEHEALVALVARHQGVTTPEVVAVTTAEPNGFVLAYEAIDGRSLDRVDPEDVTDDLLRRVWQQVAILRGHRIAHRDLRLANVFVAADGEVWMIDFGFSELAASDTLLATDIAELLASSALLVGAERAVDNAVEVLGSQQVAAAVPRLRPWALSGATRTAVSDRPGLVDEITRRISAGSSPAPT